MKAFRKAEENQVQYDHSWFSDISLCGSQISLPSQAELTKGHTVTAGMSPVEWDCSHRIILLSFLPIALDSGLNALAIMYSNEFTL